MAKKKKIKKVKRLVEMFTDELSIVTRGANGHKEWLMVKSDGDIGQIVIEDVDKAVPAKDATTEAKEKAHQARSRQYGIEMHNDASMSYPAGAPTTERLYADPANLKYPMAYEGASSPDPARTRNALARFKQNYQTYSEKASRARVYERIVRAAMSLGIDVSYDANDPVDQLLPGDLKTRLQKSDDESAEESSTDLESTESDTSESETATSDEDEIEETDWLDDIQKSVKRPIDDEWFAGIQKTIDSVDESQDEVSVDGDTEEPDDKSEPVKKSDDSKEDKTLKKESEKKDTEIKKLKKDITALTAKLGRLSNGIGSAHSIRPGELNDKDDRNAAQKDDHTFDMSPPLTR